MSKKTKFADVMTAPSIPISTGLKSLDEVTNKFNPGEAVIITSVDPMSGTAFVLSLALKASAGARIPTLLLSSITSTEQMAKWVFLGMDDFQEMPKNAPLYIEETKNKTIDELKERIVEMVKNSLVEVVIIDSIDYIYQTLPAKDGQRITSLYEFIREMKQLARELSLVLVMTARAFDNMELPKEIKIIEPIVDLLIGIEMLDAFKDQDKRLLIVNKNEENIATLLVMFDRRRAKFYDEGVSYEPGVYKEEAEREVGVKCQ